MSSEAAVATGWIPGIGQNLFSVIVELGCDQEMSVQSMAVYRIALQYRKLLQ